MSGINYPVLSSSKNFSIGILITTTNRRTLLNSLLSIKFQDLHYYDQIILATDGYYPEVATLWNHWKCGLEINFTLWQRDGHPRGDWGHSLRNEVLASGELNTDAILHLDDDDALAPHAIRTIRKYIIANPGSPLIFRMIYNNGKILWKEPMVKPGNVGSPMLVHPRRSSYPLFTNRRLGDYDFISAITSSTDVLFCPEITILVRPAKFSPMDYC